MKEEASQNFNFEEDDKTVEDYIAGVDRRLSQEQAILLGRTNKLQEDYESLFEEIKLLWEETTVIKLFLTNYFKNEFTRFQQTTKRSGKAGAKKEEV